MYAFRKLLATIVLGVSAISSFSAHATTTTKSFSLTPDLLNFSVSESGQYSFSVWAAAVTYTATLYSGYESPTNTGTVLATDTDNAFGVAKFHANLQSGITYTYSLVSRFPSVTLAKASVTGPGDILPPVPVALPAVPEPEEYAMLLAGLAAVVFAVRRRKNTAAASLNGLSAA